MLTVVNLHVLFVCIAACECNSHADSCTYNETKGYGVCNDCKHNTIGDKCELCKVSFYRNVAVPRNDSNTCLGKFTTLAKQPFVELQNTHFVELQHTCIQCTHV